MIPLETSYMTFRIATDPTNQHGSFQHFFVLIRTLFEKLYIRSPVQKLQLSLNISLIFLSLFNKPKQTACYLQPLIRLEYI